MEDFVKIKDLNIPSESLIGKGITAFLRSSQDVVYGKCERIRKDGGILIKTSSKIVSLGIGTQVKIFD